MVPRLLKLSRTYKVLPPWCPPNRKIDFAHEQSPPLDRSLHFNLLDPELGDYFSRNPKEPEYRAEAATKGTEWIALDEIQKIPRLLDTLLGFLMPPFHELICKQQPFIPNSIANHGVEIDVILDRPGMSRVFIEIKSATMVDERDVVNIAKFQAESKKPAQALLVSRFSAAKRIGKVLCLPWERSFEELGL